MEPALNQNIFFCETIILANKSKSLTLDKVKVIFILCLLTMNNKAVDEIKLVNDQFFPILFFRVFFLGEIYPIILLVYYS